MKSPFSSPWINPINVGVPNYATYNGKNVVLATAAAGIFATTLRSLTLPFQYDYAVAITKYIRTKTIHINGEYK
jgi:hypothetical protein